MANSPLPIPRRQSPLHRYAASFFVRGPWPSCVAHHPVPTGWLSLHQGAGNQIGIRKFGGDREFERALPGVPHADGDWSLGSEGAGQ